MKFIVVSLGLSVGLLVATSPALAQCTDADGDHYYVQVGCGTAQDCDDANAGVYPGAPPLCDGLRNDCNGPSCSGGGPEDCDADGDGVTPCGGDCDDANPFVAPGAAQTCDGANNDCGDPLWPSVPDSELDVDGDDFPTCTGSCEVRVTTDASVLSSARAGLSSGRSIVATENGFVFAYKTVRDWGAKLVRVIRLDRWGRRVADPVEVASLPSSGPFGNPILAKAGVGFGIAWEARPSPSFQLLGDDLAPIGTRISIGDACEGQADADLHGVVWNGFEFAIVFGRYCDDHFGTFVARVGSDGLQIGVATEIVDMARPSTMVWNGEGYALAWEDGGALFFQRLQSGGTPDGDAVTVGPAVSSSAAPSLVWTGGDYAVAWTDDRSGDQEIYLARLNANGQRLGADTRVSNASGDSVDPRLVWSGDDYRVAWSDNRDGSGQVYFARVAASGEVIEPDRRVSSAPLGAGAPAAVWSGTQTMMIYSAGVPPPSNFFAPSDIFAARESCHDCADNNASVFPGAPQICDGVNNDCLDPSWPTPPPDDRDDDGDGETVCEGDCDDSNAAVHPGAIETCNALDDDCNGQLDEDAAGVDSDADNVHNACDNCRFASNASQRDSDGDAVGEACDNCPLLSNPNQADPDSDARGDVCDNCPAAYNAFQEDSDGDRSGDACDNCVFDSNASQSDFDHDNQGDMCDVNDGLIYVFSTDDNYREWQAENGYTSWRSYRGSLASLRATGQYTQAPGSNPLAARNCGLTETFVFDVVVPAPGLVAFNLVTGVAGGIESSLGTNSAGVPRPNANACP